MNVESAKKALEFATIVRDDPDAKIVRVPGHGGRIYFVKVTKHTVTCRRSKLQGGANCPSVGSGVICYHGLTAWEKVHGSTSWCDDRNKAHKLENLGKHTVEVRATTGGVAWAVLDGKPVSEEERRAELVELGRRYLALHDKVQTGLNGEEHEELQSYRRQLGICKVGHSQIKNLVAEADRLVLARGVEVLRGGENWEERI